jgi:hypothetical protein
MRPDSRVCHSTVVEKSAVAIDFDQAILLELAKPASTGILAYLFTGERIATGSAAYIGD